MPILMPSPHARRRLQALLAPLIELLVEAHHIGAGVIIVVTLDVRVVVVVRVIAVQLRRLVGVLLVGVSVAQAP